MSLSEVFKFTQGLGQKGHQIGRKVGDAIELLTLGMIDLDENLRDYLIIEDGIEGATSAKHKVEFAFYNLINESPSKISRDLFGIIECKKVGVEQTIKQGFKKWRAKPENKKDFFLTEGYKFTISPRDQSFRWKVKVKPVEKNDGNLEIRYKYIDSENKDDNNKETYHFNCSANSQILIALDEDYELHVLGNGDLLSTIPKPIQKCVIFKINELQDNKVSKILVNEALAGPQTPEKAKQASFVSLDVRKKVLGRFDKTEDSSFISILVVGEASHWEEKSRSMIKLCNDYNLFIPDKVLVSLFKKFEEKFGDNYQDKITKTFYRDDSDIKPLIRNLIDSFDQKILEDMETGKFVKFKYNSDGEKNFLIVEEIN
ncbi:MAG: hypothetical protein WD607_02810 [Candidatus Paceibacterota bacterium]